MNDISSDRGKGPPLRYARLGLFGLAVFHSVPEQQSLHNLSIPQICIQQPGQTFVRIQSVPDSRLDQAEHNCTGGGSLWWIGEQEVLPVNDEGLDTSFRTVVGDF